MMKKIQQLELQEAAQAQQTLEEAQSVPELRRKKLGLELADYQIGRGSISPLASRS